MDNLRGRATKALVWDLFGNYGGQITSFVISIFLARLLSPADFGLVGMSMVFIGMLQIFKDMGFASALIQNDDNTSLTYSTVFYFNVAIGLSITVLLYLAAPLIGDFYENETITYLVRLLSITFFISSFNIVQGTILRKKLDFKSLTFRDLISQVFAGVVAIILAFMDYGVYALVVQQILAAVISTILLWKISGWYPKWEFSKAELKKLSGFSFYVFAESFLSKIVNQLDTLIIGKMFSPVTLGYFSRAKSLNKLIIRNSSASITKVFFPALSEIKNDHLRFERVYFKVVHLVASLAILLTGVFFLVGEEIIITLFGEKWRPSIPIFNILILKGFTFPISSLIISAFMVKGKSKENFHYGNIRKALLLVPFVFAFTHGFYAFLYANLGITYIGFLLNNYFAYRSLNISFVKQIRAILPQLIMAIFLILFIRVLFPDGINYINAVFKVICFSSLYILFLRIINSPIFSELQKKILKAKSK